MQRLQRRDHRRHHIGRHARPAPTRREQIREHLIGEQLPPIPGRESKHTARLEQMTRDRLRTQQFPLTLRPTLHPTIIPNNTGQQADRHAALFRAPLVSCARDPLNI